MLAHNRVQPSFPHHAQQREPQRRLGVTPNGIEKPSHQTEIIDISTGSTHLPTTSLKQHHQSSVSSYSQASTQCSTQSLSQTQSQSHTQSQYKVSTRSSSLKRSTNHATAASNPRANNNSTTPAKRSDNSNTATTNSTVKANSNSDTSNNDVAAAKPVNRDVQEEGSIGFNYVEDDDHRCLIRTPGGRYLNINNYLMKVDRDICQDNVNRCPAVMNAALYDATRHWDWVRLEKEVDRRSFHLALEADSLIEQFRRFTMMCIFRFFTKWEAKASTVHYAVNNLNRIIIARTMEQKTITQQTYAGVAMACIRMAVKHEDTAKFNQLWQNPTRSLWKYAGFGKDIEDHLTLQKINEIEFEAVKTLQNPLLTPPSPLDFLDRYLSVGGWPKNHISAYRDLAHYLIDLSLFAPKMDGLVGTRPSLLAAAALMLSVKIHNSMLEMEKYEFWPKRLEVVTNYDAKKLTPVIRALSTIVKNKPHGEELLSKYHEAWSNRSWR